MITGELKSKIDKVEHLREEFRSLMRFIQSEKRPSVYTDLDDEVLQVAEPQPTTINAFTGSTSWKD